MMKTKFLNVFVTCGLAMSMVACSSANKAVEELPKEPVIKTYGVKNENTKELKLTNNTENEISVFEVRPSVKTIEHSDDTDIPYGENMLPDGQTIECGETVIIYIPGGPVSSDSDDFKNDTSTENAINGEVSEPNETQEIEVPYNVDIKIGMAEESETSELVESDDVEKVEKEDSAEKDFTEFTETSDVFEITDVDTDKVDEAVIEQTEDDKIEFVYKDAETNEDKVIEGYKVDTGVAEEVIAEKKEETEPKKEEPSSVVEEKKETTASSTTANTQTESKPSQSAQPAHQHVYNVPITKTVTDYEEQQIVVSQAWDEAVYETRDNIICNGCGTLFSSAGAMREHGTSYALNGDGSHGSYSIIPYQVQTGTIHHDAVYSTQSVPVGTHEEIVGYKCSCGATK